MVSDYLEVVIYFVLFFTNINFFHDFIFHESEIRTVLLEVSIDLGLLKKSLLKTSKIVLMYSNSLLRHFSSMVHAKCLLPNIDRLLLVRSCLQNFYQCCFCLRLYCTLQDSSLDTSCLYYNNSMPIFSPSTPNLIFCLINRAHFIRST